MKAKFKKSAIAISVALAFVTILPGCVGGGGGSPGVIPDQAVAARQVPFYTPSRAATFQPSVQSFSSQSAVTVGDYEAFAVDLDNKGYDDIIVTGRLWPFTANDAGSWSNSYVKIFSWENSVLVDKTAQWFPNNDNFIYGVEDSIKVGNFDGSGRKSLYAAPYNDGYSPGGTQVYGDGTLFINNGTTFTKIAVPVQREISQSVVYDMNNDGFDDIFQQSYWGPVITFGSNTGTFKTYISEGTVSGVGAAVADFMGNGTSTIVITENGPGWASRSDRVTALYSWNIDVNDKLNIVKINDLPTRRFLLPKWASYNFSGAHDVAALAFNFDAAGLTDAIVISRPDYTNGVWPKYSEVQFLRNDGGGVFTDVTDTTLVNYNTSSEATMNPTLADVNNDGLTDIVLGTSSGMTVLVHTQEHKYVASYSAIIDAFTSQAKELESAVRQVLDATDNYAAFVKGPNNTIYLVTTVSVSVGGTIQKSLYLAKVGDNTVTAQATVNLAKQIWPWMSDAQVNQILAASSKQWLGFNILDEQAALNPIGALSVSTSDGKVLAISGTVSGLNLTGISQNLKVFDSFGRDFTVDYKVTNYASSNYWATNLVNNEHNDATRSIANLRDVNVGTLPNTSYGSLKVGVTSDKNNITANLTESVKDLKLVAIGLTGIKLSDNLYASVQYTNLPYSPFVQLSGSWGSVTRTENFETSLTYKSVEDFEARVGMINTRTEISKGLVTQVNPLTSVWTEAGYNGKNFKMFAGMFPKVISGSADISLPTSVDINGKAHFTSYNVGIESKVVNYVRASYSDTIGKNKSFGVNAIATTERGYNVNAVFKMVF